ncbi:hypothetical protein Sjap_006632 [Stephania japonica]|uniref:Uncharacterized protein n=1 Tax=Stephania japonica TaxID=461633 RepID=A0AAP0K7S0_9MAGN
MDSSIYKVVTEAYSEASRGIERVPSVATFQLCYSSKNVSSTPFGSGVPFIDLVLQNERNQIMYWRFWGNSSMVRVNDDVLCLEIVDGAQTSFRPNALILKVTKDPCTLQYLTRITQRAPPKLIDFVVDLGGRYLWVDCDYKDYVSSSYRPVPCGSAGCALAGNNECGQCYSSSPISDCNLNTCLVRPDNTITYNGTGGEVSYDIVTLQSMNGSTTTSKEVNVSVPAEFIFGCSANFLLDGLVKGVVRRNGWSRPDKHLITFAIRIEVVTEAYSEASRGIERVPSVATFQLCYSSKNVSSTPFGSGVPFIDLVLQNERNQIMYSRFWGNSSMVRVNDDVLCLEIVDGGVRSPRFKTSIVIGGCQLEEILLEFLT